MAIFLLSNFVSSWQAVRHRDVTKEKEKMEDALLNLTTREREIRKRIEDTLDPNNITNNTTNNCGQDAKAPLKSNNTKLTNGHTNTKTKLNGNGTGAGEATTTKKGKKRKAPS